MNDGNLVRFPRHLYQIFVDIGSTALAAHLCGVGSGEVLSSAGMMNPQIRWRRPDESCFLFDAESGW